MSRILLVTIDRFLISFSSAHGSLTFHSIIALLPTQDNTDLRIATGCACQAASGFALANAVTISIIDLVAY
jgi:hypothetical protein